MLTKFSPQIFKRQQDRFPEYIQALESLSQGQEATKTTFLSIAAIVAHGLRNDLTVIAVVLELEEIQEADKVPHTVV